eukprot:TRINITY_DN19689_c0_g1_i1.p1 TRINITY_DN19689_c0_g1~~TRINITY_DN19689_c0_g1_i1.p1  ORF type:complete len:322 (+),score=46.62 TRINITY_DN19689_c0_g1_i1:581-1546(+)
MIDAHNKFVRGWDSVLIDQHNRTGRAKSVLSTYPMALTPLTEAHGSPTAAYLCALGKSGGWTSGFPGPFWANGYRESRWPKPSPYIGAGLMFGPGSILADVPFDPNLPYLFFGEEFLFAVRLWTNGYDLYSPGVNILYHRYARGGHRPDVAAAVMKTKEQSQRRVQHILGVTRRGSATERVVPLGTEDRDLTAGLPRYGLGTERSLWQYWRFALLDPVIRSRQTFSDHWCSFYGPKSGPAPDDWRRHTQIHDTPASEWWVNGVARLSVPPTYRASDYVGPGSAAPACADEYPDKCPGWAEAGECEKNSGMHSFCARSCRRC